MDIAFAIWFLSTLTMWLGGMAYAMVEPIHNHRSFYRYYLRWGSYRFYTLAFIAYTVLVPFWFFVVLYFYIVGIVKKK